VGYDIACGNKAVMTDIDAKDIDLKNVMDEIFKQIGFGVGRPNPKPVDHPVFDKIAKAEFKPQKKFLNMARVQLGTVGGGNHYVDLFEEVSSPPKSPRRGDLPIPLPKGKGDGKVSPFGGDLEGADRGASLLDIGTGSGCIAVTLAAELPHTKVYALDNNKKALNLAEENARINNVKIDFIESDIGAYKKVAGLLPPINLIVSNPPYVIESEKRLMDENVTGFEPHQALFVKDKSPLIFYKHILELSRKILLPNGKVYFETNEQFAKQVALLFERYQFKNITIKKDMQGKERFVRGRIIK